MGKLKREIISEARLQLDNMGIGHNYGNNTDISIDKEFTYAAWNTASKKLSYKANIHFDETEQTVFMHEKIAEIGSGLSIGTQAESPAPYETTQLRKVKSVHYGPDGKELEYELELGSISNMFKLLAENNGWKFNSVPNEKKAMYPEGYIPPFTPPEYKVPAEKAVLKDGVDGDVIVGYCTECGAELTSSMNYCAKCGHAEFMNIKFAQHSTQEAKPGSKQNVAEQGDNESSRPAVSTIAGVSAPLNQKPSPVLDNRKGTRAGKLGFIALMALGIVLMLFLVADKSGPVAWGSVIIAFAVAVFVQRKISRYGLLVNLSVFIVSAVVMIFVFAMAATMVSASNARIVDGYMTNGVDAQGLPVGKVNGYGSNAKSLIAVGMLRNAPSNTKIRFVWSHGGTVVGDYSTSNGETGPNIYIFSYLKPKKMLEKGAYSVEIYLQDRRKPDVTVEFMIAK